MKRLVKISSVLLVVILAVTLIAGCNSKDKDVTANPNGRVLYSKENLEKFVTLCDYKGIEIDTASEDFKSSYDELAKKDAQDKSLTKKLTEGKVQNGDVANIDYCGKKDGVAFEGGTDEGHDLEIGSHSFITGFEEGLVGVSIGDTVDLYLTFPEGYQSEELAGKAVVFTVKVNYVTRNKTAEEIYSDMGFNSFEDYDKDLKYRVIKNILSDYVVSNSTVSGYPESDINHIYKVQLKIIENTLKTQYNMTLESYLQYSNMTEDAFKSNIIENSLKPSMKEQMVFYAIADKENIELKKDEINSWAEEYLKSIGNSSSVETVKSSQGDYYFEVLFAKEKVLSFLYENANIK